MKKIAVTFFLVLTLAGFHNTVYSQTINEADTERCETLKYALINSLRAPIDKAINEIYKDDKDAPEGLTWASYMTEIIKIEQLSGVGGAYKITLKVMPYYRAHITYGEDLITVSAEGVLIDYKHLKTYPTIEFN